MKSVLRKLGLLVVFCLAMHQTALATGVAFEIDNMDARTGEPIRSTVIMVERDNLKMIVTAIPQQSSATGVGGYDRGGADMRGEDDDVEIIYNAERKEATIVNKQGREYFVINETFMDNVQAQYGDVGQHMGQMNAIMQQAYETALAQLDTQGMSPRERAEAEQVLRNTFGISGGAPTSAGPTEARIIRREKDTVNGFPVVWYERPGTGRVAVTKWDDLGPGAKARDTVKSYFEFTAKLSKGGFESDSSIFDAMGEIDGFPAAGEDAEGNWILRSVKKMDFGPDAFKPGPGFTQKQMFGRPE